MPTPIDDSLIFLKTDGPTAEPLSSIYDGVKDTSLLASLANASPAVEELVADPTFQSLSPRARTLFQDARRRVLPGLVR